MAPRTASDLGQSDRVIARRLVRRTWALLPWLIAAGGALALALDGTLGDRVPYLAALHYATPLPIIALSAVLGLGLGVAREHFVAAALCALVLATSVAEHRATAYRPAAPLTLGPVIPVAVTPVAGRTVRGVLWNVERDWHTPQRVIDEALAFDADLVVFVEPLRDEDGDRILDLGPRMPGYAVAAMATKFVVAVRGKIVRVGEVEHLADASIAAVDVVVGGHALTLVCVDVGSNPWTPRKPSIVAIARAVERYADGRALLLGDFNTPRRSVHMDRLRASWFHAFEEAGTGFDMSWPEPVPVLSIDHVFTSRSIRTIACRTVPTHVSDHRPLLFEIDVP